MTSRRPARICIFLKASPSQIQHPFGVDKHIRYDVHILLSEIQCSQFVALASNS